MRRALAFVTAVVLATGCEEGTRVRVETAADFRPASGATVSVFGVFRDGRMSADSWKPLAPTVSRALGRDACPVGWGDALREAEPDLAQWVDEDTRENGLDEQLFARIAPKAKGDLVMVLVAYRFIPQSRARGVTTSAPRVSPMGRGRRGRSMRSAPPSEEEERVFELSASLYSVRLKKLVAEIDLRDTGSDLDEAMKSFAEKLRAVVPGATCVGWTWPEPAESTDNEPVAAPPAPAADAECASDAECVASSLGQDCCDHCGRVAATKKSDDALRAACTANPSGTSRCPAIDCPAERVTAKCVAGKCTLVR